MIKVSTITDAKIGKSFQDANGHIFNVLRFSDGLEKDGIDVTANEKRAF